jgi:F0F1-type ATP synthase membrane subunit a
MPEVPNLITILNERWGEMSFIKFLHHWENIVFAGLIILLITIIAYLASSRKSTIPERLQSIVEMAVEELDNLVCGIIGPGAAWKVSSQGRACPHAPTKLNSVPANNAGA